MNNLGTTKLTIADPEVDFEVIDFGPDGIGDEVFPTFNTVVLGLPGEGVLALQGNRQQLWNLISVIYQFLLAK
jgi:hypothetical protein